MADPFVGEIRMFASSFAPMGWAFCDGSLLPIAQFEALYNLIGTTYGGDGQTTFALPDLRGRVPVHYSPGTAYGLGQKGGVETVTLTAKNTAQHSHAIYGTSAAPSSGSPVGNVWADNSAYIKQFAPASTANGTMGGSLTSDAGGGVAHENMLPFTAINFIIAVFGIWPS